VTVALALSSSEPLALTVYNYRPALFGVSFIFAALTDLFQRGILLQPARNQTSDTLVPILLLGHLVGVLPVQWERAMLPVGLFVCRVCTPQGCASNSTDIGDKSVFAYLKEQHSAKA